MCSYIRKFIPNFSATLKPLSILSRKFVKFTWTKECQVALAFLKESLKTVPVLANLDTIKPYNLYTDAGDDCTGACKEQNTKGEMKSNQPNEKPT